MKIAITGGTGFVGRHLARRLIVRGHEVVLIARGVYRRDPGVRELDGSKFFPIGTGNEDRLAEAFTGCSAIAHCAGINRELGKQTYADVHVQGTRNVVNAAKRAGVRNILLLSFLRARPHCGSAYHESKWQAEEIVRSSGLEYTVLKPGVIYGRGDHLLDHHSHALHTFPAFAAIGLRGSRLRPLAVDDLTRIMEGVLSDGRLSYQTVAVTGPEELRLSEVVRRVGKVIGKRALIFPLPTAAHYFLAWWFERLMVIPLVSVAQVRILTEQVIAPVQECHPLPSDLMPRLTFNEDQIRKGLPAPQRFGLSDLRLFRGYRALSPRR